MRTLTDCAECARPCDLHNVTRCLTCHDHPGECGYGGCTDRATYRLVFVNEHRLFCETHAIDPFFGFARRGMKSLARLVGSEAS